MASGNRAMVINTQERAISTDINRLQSFSSRDEAEAMRFFIDVVTDEMDPGFVHAPSFADGRTAGAEIIGGFMVRPQVGSFNVLIDEGVMYIMSPDGGPDDSNYKFVHDFGVTTPGALTLASNVSGSIRIDVIECSINPVPTIVTDNRDIFNAVTGLFTASTVTKEVQGRLLYRVRQGTPGQGYPGGPPSGQWVALAIASVPTGTSSNDTVTFWDVRPLIADRPRLAAVGTIGTGAGAQQFHPQLTKQDMRVLRVSAGSCLVSGYWEALLNGRKLGGDFRRGTPGTDSVAIDIGDIANQDTSITEPLTGNVYLYALQPFDLPRWSRYTDAPSARVPRTTKGLIVASYTAPVEFGYPSTAIAFPASTGLGGSGFATSTSNAACIGIVPKDLASHFSGGFAQERLMRFAGGSLSGVVATTLVGTVYTFEMTDVIWPPNVKEIELEFLTQVTYPAGSFEEYQALISVYDSDTTSGAALEIIKLRDRVINPFGSPTSFNIVHRAWFPRPTSYPTGALASPRKITWNIPLGSGTLAVAGSATLSVEGYKL